MSERTVAEYFPNITVDIDEGGIVLDAMFLLRVAYPTGRETQIVLATTPDLDWMLQLGMIRAAEIIASANVTPTEQ